MAIPPHLLDFNHQYQFVDQNFGSSFTGDNILMDLIEPILNRDYFRSRRQQSTKFTDVGSTFKNDKNKFQLILDVQHFSFEDLAVKIIDNYIVIEGKHDEKQDENGFISREFKRRYEFPAGCDPEKVECELSSDGVMTITAPKRIEASHNERNVPIVQTGPVRKESKDQDTQATQDNEE